MALDFQTLYLIFEYLCSIARHSLTYIKINLQKCVSNTFCLMIKTIPSQEFDKMDEVIIIGRIIQ